MPLSRRVPGRVGKPLAKGFAPAFAQRPLCGPMRLGRKKADRIRACPLTKCAKLLRERPGHIAI